MDVSHTMRKQLQFVLNLPIVFKWILQLKYLKLEKYIQQLNFLIIAGNKIIVKIKL